MSGFVSPLRFKDKGPKLAMTQPSLVRRLIWKFFGRCKHRLYAVDHVPGTPGVLCVRKKQHKGEHVGVHRGKWRSWQ